MCLYWGANKRVRMDFGGLMIMRLKWECAKDLCCQIFMAMADANTELARDVVLRKMQHDDGFVLVRKTSEGLSSKPRNVVIARAKNADKWRYYKGWAG